VRGNPISLAIVNARVWTGDPAAPWAEAIAVSGDELAAVGTNDDIRNRTTGATPIDAGGRHIAIVSKGVVCTESLRRSFVPQRACSSHTVTKGVDFARGWLHHLLPPAHSAANLCRPMPPVSSFRTN